MANFNQNLVFNGLGTISLTVPVAGPYVLRGHMSLPMISKGDTANSELVVVVNKNGSPIYTGLAGAEGFQVKTTCSALDVLAFVFSSAAAVDQPLNVIKSCIDVSIGV